MRIRTGPNEIRCRTPAHLVLIRFAPQSRREIMLNGAQRSVLRAAAGSMEIMPASSDLFARWTTPKDSLLLALDHDPLARLAGIEPGTDDFEFHPPQPGTIDEKATFIAAMIKDEMDHGIYMNTAYFNALITVLKIHLLRGYSSLVPSGPSPDRGGLPPHSWRKVTDYIQANLAADLSIPHLAGLLGLSPSHFLRCFRQSCGRAPHQYVLEQRLALAEHLARTTRTPLAKVAEMAGFSSASHMTAMMRRLRNATPGALRREARQQHP
ncbi:helix-turn-helix domain-containing protein [Roseicella sp. DB1501]|uniref:helix-turn-helix domain-containing protein n=1 Tax=Roseicella sp. DB1501 TaxID=2730925 RepID=UPI00149288F0|nr:AraC family transcriptional regulator [Roseicella sp. DB1501]NOG71646.1 helix-turn-helix transcriptional regulator [Roseicella sp. DB1501]